MEAFGSYFEHLFTDTCSDFDAKLFDGCRIILISRKFKASSRWHGAPAQFQHSHDLHVIRHRHDSRIQSQFGPTVTKCEEKLGVSLAVENKLRYCKGRTEFLFTKQHFNVLLEIPM